jgi:hypothetical protein
VRIRLLWLAVVAALVAGACSTDPELAEAPIDSAPATTATVPPTTVPPTTVPPTTEPPTTVPPTTVPATTVPAPDLAAVDCAVTPTLAQPHPDRPRYEIDVTIQPDTGEVSGNMTVDFTPDTRTDQLVFRLWPNAPRIVASGGSMTVGPVEVNGVPVGASQPDPTTLVVPLERPIESGETVTAAMAFNIVVPEGSESRVSRTLGSLRLGTGFPILPWEPGVGWALDPPTILFAEATSSPVADYRVRIDVPEGFDVLATGQMGDDGYWVGEAVRDFAITVGRFATETVVVDAPEPIEVTVGVHDGLIDDPVVYLEKASRALEEFAATFGPYPWPSLTIAIVPGLGGGIEFPTHIMQGPSTLGRVLSHEIGHMFFYSLVGNNQGRDPWLDEGLATVLEARFEGSGPTIEELFIPLDAEGLTGAPMAYWDDHGASYYRGVYVQGANAVEALGTVEQVDCILRWYLAGNAYGIATPEDLAEVAEQVVPDARAVLVEYGALGG